MSGSTWTWIGGTINADSPSDWTLTTGPGNASGIPETGDTAINNGTLVGYGLIAAALINNGTVEAANNSVPGSSTGGDLEIQGAVSGTGSMTIAPGATLQIDGSLGSGQSITFSPGAPEALILGAPAGTISNPITGFAEGDKIEFGNGINVESASVLNGNTMAVDYETASGVPGVYDLTDVSFAANTPTTFLLWNDDPITNDPLVMPTRYFYWVGGSGTNFATAANWNIGTLAPGATDSALFNLAGGGTISGTGAAEYLFFYNGGTWSMASGTSLSASVFLEVGGAGGGAIGAGTLNIGSGSTISSAGYILVGTNAGSNASMTVSGGGVVLQTGPGNLLDSMMDIGGSASGTLAAGSGTVTVTGAGSLIDLGNSGIAVGGHGNGLMTVSQGASVIAGALDTHDLVAVAIGTHGSGTLVVTDPGSEFTSNGGGVVGRGLGSNGTLIVENHATYLSMPDPLGIASIIFGSGYTSGSGGTGVGDINSGGVFVEQGDIFVGTGGDAGLLNVDNGTVTVGTSLVVGNADSITGTLGIFDGSGTLVIGTGGTVALTGTSQAASYAVIVGDSSVGPGTTANGTVTVSGAGAILNTNGDGLAVGYVSLGTLAVSQGGSVASGTQNSSLIAALAIGRQGDGSVTVTDAGSQLTADGGSYIGRAGDGSLIVENQGSVVIGLDGLGVGGLSIGGAGTSTGGLLYAGGTGTALVTSGGDVFSQAYVVVGQDGATGTLTVESGGTVEAGARLLVGDGTTLEPGATLITPTSTTAVTSATVENGTGVVTIGAASTLKVDSDGITTSGTSAVRLGNLAGDSGSIAVSGVGAFLNAGTNWIDIGNEGTGVLTVSQGGSVLAGVLSTLDAATVLGNDAGSSGFLTVSDPGSTYDAVGQVDVGSGGVGNLTVQNQGTLLSGKNSDSTILGFTIARDAGSSGNVTVTGPGSEIVNVGHFEVGGSGNSGNPSGGTASLLIEDGGTVQTSIAGPSLTNPAAAIAADPGTDGSNANVTGVNSTWQIAGALLVGEAADGLLSISAGGTVTASQVDAGTQTGSSGDIVVNGTASELTTTGLFTVGDGGNADMAVSNGATVQVGGDLDLGQLAGSSGNVDIENAAVTVGGDLNLGLGGGAGVLTVGTGGTLHVTGGLVGGADSALNEFGLVDPNFDDGVNAVVGVSGTQDFPGYIDDFASFTIDAGVTLTLESPSIYGDVAFVLGGRRDTTSDTLVLNAGSVSADTTVTFNNAHGTLVLGSDALASIDIQANDTAAATFVANPNLGMPTINQFHAVIDSFQAGDQITVQTTAAATFVQNGAVVEVFVNGTSLGDLTFASTGQASLAELTDGALGDQVICFCPGALIATPDGEVPVERLAVGDKVVTHRGDVRPITWIGNGRVLATRGRRSAATPVIIRKGALADNVPHHDLRVTKGHSFYLDGALIPVEFLVNHRSIEWDDRAQEVTLYHIELESHDVLLANGAPAESYRDDGNRWLFQNANSGWDLAPQTPCAPLLTGGPVVDAVWRRLLERSGLRRRLPLTEDPDLHLLVDGERLDAAARHGAAHIFCLPARPAAVRIVSRAGAPAELGLARDPRVLGVALRRLAVRQGTRFRVMEAADPTLAEGFHAFEPDNGLRWTDGDAAVPEPLFEGFDGPMELVLHMGGTASYLADYPARRVA